MKILIIDNGTRFLPKLVGFAKNSGHNDVKIAKRNLILNQDVANSDLIILSGSPSNPVALHPDAYQDEIELVRKTDKPVLGICMGFEIIAYAYGSDLERLENEES